MPMPVQRALRVMACAERALEPEPGPAPSHFKLLSSASVLSLSTWEGRGVGDEVAREAWRVAGTWQGEA
eukprot:1088539-Rhodomonas_salina.5